jgi:hypothetical protein
LPAQEPFARPCGKYTDYRCRRTGSCAEGDKAPNIMPFLELDWSHSVEARRLYFMIGYMWEMGVAEMQLRWLFYADFMPWKFLHDEARHMWDESRHGNSAARAYRALASIFAMSATPVTEQLKRAARCLRCRHAMCTKRSTM